MIGMDTIRITKNENSKLDLSRVKEIFVDKLKNKRLQIVCVAWYNPEEEEVKVVLKNSISLNKAHQIIHIIQNQKIIIKEFTWKENEVGPVRRGTLDIIVS